MHKFKFIILICISVIVVGCKWQHQIVLKNNNDIILEYGEKINMDPKRYLVEETNDKILKRITTKIYKSENGIVKNEEIKNISILEVGTYILEFSYQDETGTIYIYVSDTVAPEFVSFKEEISVSKDDEFVDLTSFYACEDLSTCTLKIDDEKLDLTREGRYKINVIATDKYENRVERESIVNVIDDSKDESSNDNIKQDSNSNIASNGDSSSKENDSSISNNINPPINNNEDEDVPEENKQLSQYFPELAKEVYTLINKERKKVGLAELPWANELENVCDKRSMELYDEHLNGNVHSGLLKYDPYGRLGEIACLGKGLNTPEFAIESWLNSTGHKNWMLNDYNTKMVVSVYYNDENEYYNYIVLFVYDSIHTNCVNGVCTDYRMITNEDGSKLYCLDNVCKPFIEMYDEETVLYKRTCSADNTDGWGNYINGEWLLVDYDVCELGVCTRYYKNGYSEKFKTTRNEGIYTYNE